MLDDAGTTCYQVDPGVTVHSVVKVTTVADKDGTYSVRVVLAPESRKELADLTKDALNQLLAVVVDDKVVTAPRVAQAITQDSLSIAGLTKETADALMSRLLGSGGPVTGTSGPSPETPAQTSTCPPADGTTQPTGPTDPVNPVNPVNPTGPAGTDGNVPPGDTSTCPPGAGAPTGAGTGTGTGAPTGAGTGAPSTSASQPGSVPLAPPSATHTPAAGTQTSPSARNAGVPQTNATGSTTMSKRTPDPRFASCKQAHAANYGPYTKGVHVEYGWYVDGDHDGVACERGDIT